ncbi:MAG TPA: hypothetical protein VMX97_09495, partial [Hyphomicrobiaceae bacterium]|nr:hypothetical protein [Hyphomicrobiaceae bacterium]
MPEPDTDYPLQMTTTVPYTNNVPPTNSAPRGRAPSAPVGLGLFVSPEAFTVFTIIMMTSAFYFLFIGPADVKEAVSSTARNNPVYMGLWLVLYAWAARLVARDVMERGISRGALPLMIFSALVVVSMFWSMSPKRTLLYGGMLVANFLVGYALAASMPPARFLSVLGRTIAVLLFASFILILVDPDMATSERWGGAWLSDRQYQGVFAHKSDAGYYFAVLSLILAHGRFPRPMPIVRTVLFMLTVFAIVIANSATALAAAIVLNGLLVLADRAGPLRRAILPMIFFGVLIFSIVLPMIDIGSLAGMLGRDPGLTGRVPIWEAGFPFINAKPW